LGSCFPVASFALALKIQALAVLALVLHAVVVLPLALHAVTVLAFAVLPLAILPLALHAVTVLAFAVLPLAILAFAILAFAILALAVLAFAVLLLPLGLIVIAPPILVVVPVCPRGQRCAKSEQDSSGGNPAFHSALLRCILYRRTRACFNSISSTFVGAKGAAH
jgi:hypothetical protein